MKVVNLGDPYTKRITLRLTDIQYSHLLEVADILETSPSDYIRYLIMQSALQMDPDTAFENREGTSSENVKARKHDSI